VLVTLTSRIRVHRDEVIAAVTRGNAVVLRFVSMKPMRVSVDDLTDEAREWLLPSLAPREIPEPSDCDCNAPEVPEGTVARVDEIH
jgi:hypothetical protein